MPELAAQSPASTQPLGIFGGAFDPLHYGHLRLAEEACKVLRLSEVRWVPSGQPPHRATLSATVEQRLAMLRLGIAGNPCFSLDESETLSTAPSYSVPTLERLRAQFGAQRPLVLLLGVDAFLGLRSWHRWQELFELAHLAVATRPGFSLDAERLEPPLAAEFRGRQVQAAEKLAETLAGCILVFPITALAISATALRATFKAGGSARYLLPDPVLDYIAAHHIYNS
ncbi:MAG: nicotinate-nucleotide adenylyltransferase [Sterolibacterium sp.]|nr:nicotinate-nucleotide adenylyltransferase [Sterolibacterium sp.]